MSNRHLLRSIAMQSLYEWDFRGKNREDLKGIIQRNIRDIGSGVEESQFVFKLVDGVMKHLKDIDKIIEKGAPEWPLEQINIVDRNVLRVGIYELIFGEKKSVPPKVAINEAIELAKTFGGESSGKFINGVLGTIYRQMGEPGKEEGKLSPKKTEKLAGAVVYRKINKEYQFGLVHDIYGYWTLPKGRIEKKESEEETALRELKEELGFKDTKIIKQLGKTEYIAREEAGLVKRKVTYFLVETTDSEIKLELSPGIREAKWFRLDEIWKLKMYEEIKKIFKKAVNLIGIKNSSDH